jgi:hypothetical protein
MKKELIITWVLLMFLTFGSMLVANYYENGDYLIQIIMLLAVLKFIGVIFNFMELKKAHVFWKVAIISFISLLYTSFILL